MRRIDDTNRTNARWHFVICDQRNQQTMCQWNNITVGLIEALPGERNVATLNFIGDNMTNKQRYLIKIHMR